MMNTTGPASFNMVFGPLHSLASIALLIGIVFLIVWAIKTLTPAQLKTWGITLAVIGAIVCLLTISARGESWGGYARMGDSEMKMMRMDMMEKMMDDDDDRGMDMGMDDHDAMGMSMDDMSEMLEGKTGDAFDKAFIEGMIPHHQGAIDMARAALKSAGHEEIKQMARAIIAAQQSEIDMMNGWLKDWGYTE